MKDWAAQRDAARGDAETWRFDAKCRVWYGPKVDAGLTLGEARALLTGGDVLVRWHQPHDSPPVLVCRSVELLDRFTAKPCTVSECSRPVKARGLCELHFSRVMRAERKARALEADNRII